MGSNGVYLWRLAPTVGQAAAIDALGVAIEKGAIFSPSVRRDSALPLGTGFIAISNTSATAIAGEFANLPDGSTLAVGLNKFLVAYEGGDGNDLTLTTVP